MSFVIELLPKTRDGQNFWPHLTYSVCECFSCSKEMMGWRRVMLAPSYLEYICIQYILITCIYNLTITHAIYNLFICFYIIYYQLLSLHNCSWVPPLSFSSYIINVETISFEIRKGFDFTGHVLRIQHVQWPLATGVYWKISQTRPKHLLYIAWFF